MKLTLTITALVVLSCVSVSLVGQSKFTSKRIERYPHELLGFKLYAKGNWKSLKPFVSTKDDVYRIFGEPSPVFVPYDDNWQVIVHYFESGSTNGRSWGESLKGTMYSIDFHPLKTVSFKGHVFPPAFKCGEIGVSHSPAPLIQCSDGTGLSYLIYKADSDDGSIRKGDLRKIVYGASDKLLKRIRTGDRTEPKHNKSMDASGDFVTLSEQIVGREEARLRRTHREGRECARS